MPDTVSTLENAQFKQMVEQESAPSAPLPMITTVFTGAGLQDLTPGTAFNQVAMATFTITIAGTGSPNTFDWSKTGGSGSASANGVAITGAAQTLSDGFQITFGATTGHTAGNAWTIKCLPRARMYWDSAGIVKQIWSNGNTTVVANPAGGDVTSIIGTANQVIADSPTGAVTLSLPQSIATTSSPTFKDITLTSTNTSTAYADALETTIAFNPSGATTAQHAGYYNNVSSAGTSNFNTPGGLYGIENYVTGAGTGTVFNMLGELIYVENTTHPTVTTLVGEDVNAFSDAGSTVTDLAGIRVYTGFTGTALTNRYGVFIAANTGAGTTTNGYGLKIDDQTAATNNYSIYTGSGNVRIGALTASQLVGTDASKNLVSISTSAGLASAISDETGSGALVFGTSPTLVTPALGVATATSINKVAVTAPATSATLTLADGSSLVTSGANSITLTSTGATNVTLPTSGTLVNDAVTTLSSLASVGTITTGVWQGTDIAAGYLADTAVTPGSYTNASITVDQQGRLTAASSGAAGNVFSALTAATGTNSINNVNHAQTWGWNSLTTETGLTINSSSVSSGTVLALAATSTAAASQTQKVLSVATSGANATGAMTTTGASFSNTHTGTTSHNIGATFDASGGTYNFAAKFPTGNVLVGTGAATPDQTAGEVTLEIATTTTSPVLRLHRPSASEYRIGVNSSNLLYITNNNGPTALGGNTKGLIIDSNGYIGFNTTTMTNRFNFTGTALFLPGASNGHRITPNSDSDTAVVNVTNAANNLNWFTINANGEIVCNGTGSFWIGTNAGSTAKFSVRKATEQVRIEYDGSNYTSFTVGSSGDLTIAPTGLDLTLSGRLTITEGTITTSNPSINNTATWNAGGVTFTNIFSNITDTASAAASLLIDLQVGGTSQFKTDKSGNATFLGTGLFGSGKITSPGGYGAFGHSAATSANIAVQQLNDTTYLNGDTIYLRVSNSVKGTFGSSALTLDADLKLNTVGNGVYVKEGTNATMGIATLVGGTVTVNTTKVTANSRIFLTSNADGGAVGFQRVSARSAGTSFTITSSSGTDTSNIAWIILEPA